MRGAGGDKGGGDDRPVNIAKQDRWIRDTGRIRAKIERRVVKHQPDHVANVGVYVEGFYSRFRYGQTLGRSDQGSLDRAARAGRPRAFHAYPAGLRGGTDTVRARGRMGV